MSYTNILTMLDLGGIPLKAADRDDSYPIIVAGGPCTCNPEPLADFVDIFFLGEGEKVDLEVIDLYKEVVEQNLEYLNPESFMMDVVLAIWEKRNPGFLKKCIAAAFGSAVADT